MKGKIWLPNSNPAGRDAYLSDIDLIMFKNEIDTRWLDRNCLNTKEAFLIIHDLREARYERALFIAQNCRRDLKDVNRYTGEL